MFVKNVLKFVYTDSLQNPKNDEALIDDCNTVYKIAAKI